MAQIGESPHLQRQIGFWSAVAVVVGSTIGSGIFGSPAGIAEKMPGPLPMLSVWVVGGLFALCGALTLAEVGGAFPYAGGLYVFLREAYGRPMGFLFGWAQLLLIRPAALGAVAVIFGEYALRLGGLDPDSAEFARYATYAAIGALVVVAFANVRGVRWGTGIQNVTTILKTGGLMALVVLAFARGLPGNTAHFTPAVPAGSFSFAPFGLALVSVLWAFDGWSDSTYVSGEIADPRRNVPRSIFLGTAIIIAVYLLANLAYLSVLSVGEIAASKQVAADVMQGLVGPAGLAFIVATVMLSTFGTLNGSMLTAPRIFYAMAEDKLFFPAVARVHPRYHTPYVSVVLTAAIGIVFVSIGSFAQLADAFVTAMVPFYALAVGSVFVFRARAKRGAATPPGELPPTAAESGEEAAVPDHPHYDPPVRTPLYPFVPALFILSTLMLLANAVMDGASRWPTLGTFAAILVGLPVYWATAGRKGGISHG
ncbi:MAG: amino acid permease [Fimbriimonadaceae bacterium]|nr:amino acid permease [Chthonomonadaceae bacterium]MCO5295237.1 amino acid permease [Fimbriimonadaceae bacterium]